MLKKIKEIKPITIVFVIIFGIFIFNAKNVGAYVGNKIDTWSIAGEYTYNLEEIKDDVYAYKGIVTSNIPANNYETIIFVDDNGLEHNIKGKVYINYVDGIIPYAKVISSKFSYDDKVYLYIPKGSLDYLGIMNMGTR